MRCFLTAPQADDLYEFLITERAMKSTESSVTNRCTRRLGIPCSPTPVVAEQSLLDRLINTSHQASMNGPSHCRSKAPARVIPTGNTSAS